jgi:O-methyltransferase involved in polyketide biosynthesis
MLDELTALSVAASRLAMEGFADSGNPSGVTDHLNEVSERWREHGFDLDFAALHYPGPRNDAADYLGGRGWLAERVSVAELLRAGCRASGTSARDLVTEGYYCTAVLTE